jgi:hypothetical protein
MSSKGAALAGVHSWIHLVRIDCHNFHLLSCFCMCLCSNHPNRLNIWTYLEVTLNRSLWGGLLHGGGLPGSQDCHRNGTGRNCAVFWVLGIASLSGEDAKHRGVRTSNCSKEPHKFPQKSLSNLSRASSKSKQMPKTHVFWTYTPWFFLATSCYFVPLVAEGRPPGTTSSAVKKSSYPTAPKRSWIRWNPVESWEKQIG